MLTSYRRRPERAGRAERPLLCNRRAETAGPDSTETHSAEGEVVRGRRRLRTAEPDLVVLAIVIVPELATAPW